MLLASDAIEAVCNAAQLLVPVPHALPGDRVSGALFVARVGRGMLGTKWPLIDTASPDALLAHAAQHAWLADAPARGDVFVSRDAVGFVVGVAALPPGHCRGVGPDRAHLLGRGPDPVTYIRWARALES